MSIYVPWLDLSADGDERAPYKFNGSHVVPASSDPRDGFFCISAISEEAAPEGSENWLRWDMCDDAWGEEMQTVLTDRAQVEKIRDTLTLWLERPSGVDE